MQLHNLKASIGARKRRKIVGRGQGSGHGKTSGRGSNGEKSRSGRSLLRSLEGGQMPLIRRLPKVGFRRRHQLFYQVINVQALNIFKEGTVVTPEMLKEKGLINRIHKPVKILGDGDLKHAITIDAHSFSRSAKEKIEKAGGKAQEITVKK